MHHGGGPPKVQRNLQRSKSFTGSEAEDQQQQQQPPQQPQQQQHQPMAVTQQQAANANHPQSPVTSFAPSASPSAPQSPNYQIIMSRSPVTGQNMNITLQNVGPMVSGNQQITLTPLPLQSPGSPSFQHQPQQWRFEPSSSYVVTSPLPQTMQPQSPTQHSPVPIQAVPRSSAPGSALGVCSQSPTRFVEAGIMVRQINLSSPPGSGHFVYQDGTGLAQLAPTTAGAVQLTSPGTPGVARERRLSQPHSQTGGTIHHLGPQSPVAAGAALPTLGSPGHITTSNLPPQISSIIQGQLARPMIFEKTAQGIVAGVAAPATASFGIPSTIPPSSPSRSNPPQGLANQSLTPTSMKKMQPKKLEEIAPSNPEVAQLRKQCLEHHAKKMESLKDVFKEYLIELFFLQHLQGNMMDYLAFKKKPCVPLFTYLRQNDLDIEDEEEEEEQSEVINDEVKVVTGKDGQTVTPVAIATQLPPNVSAAFSVPQQFQTHAGVAGGSLSNPVDMEAFKRQQAMAQADQAKRSRMDVGRHGMIFQHPALTPLGSTGVPLQQLMPTAQGGMPPTPQTVQIGGQKQNQQQYDPSKGPPVQNAASLHTPPPQLPGRLPQGGLPMAGLPLSLSQGQAMVVDQQAPVAGGQLQVKVPGAGAVLAPVNQHAQLQAQLQQMQSGLHLQMQQQMQQSVMQPGQATVALVRPGSDSSQPAQRLLSNSLSNPAMSPAPLTSPSSLSSPHPSVPVRTPSTVPSLSPAAQSKLTTTNGTTGLKMSGLGQSPVGQNSQECSQDKQAEQAKLESHVNQRIAELRKEGQWSASRLPKLQEACRPKSHWDYLLEEMQWMAADFAQERRWKMAAAKKLVRTCARYHVEQKKMEEREKREEEMRLRHIASTIARGVDYFWSNIEQVVEIKLRFEIYDKRQKVLGLQKAVSKGQCAKVTQSTGEKSDKESKGQETGISRKRKSSTSLSDVEVEDEESTIEEQEAVEVAADQKAELAELTKEAEVPLDDLVKKYTGAYAEGFEWPQPSSQSEDEDREEAEDMGSLLVSPHDAVLIDSLLSMDQYRGAERKASGPDGKPTKDIAEVAAATDLILPKGSARTTLTSGSPPPALLHGSLREYQQVAVEWLASLHRKNLNGILADETGLGKTVQTVAYFAHLACNQGIWGPHLVVVRTCKLLNWEMEFKRWCPGLKILLYLGSRKQRRYKRSRWSEPNSFHVCVTSYKLLLKDQSHFLRRRWRHLVLDEVQLIKNMTEKHWETIFNIKSQQRILLINTPLQNTLKELWTMIHFLLPGITHPYLNFPIKPGTDQNQDYCHKLVIRLHRMIQPFILRRSKRDVEKQMPKKYEHILKCRLSKRQKSMYEDILIQPSAQEALKSGHFVRVLEVLMQLQKICNHPDLIQPRDTYNSYICQPLQYNTPSLLLTALQQDQWKTVDMSLFDIIGNEGRLTRYESEEALPKLRMTKQLIEEIYNARDPPARPRPCKIKPMRLFLPVQYGTKPEGRLVPMTSSTTQAPRATTVTTAPTTTTNPATAAPSTQPRGKSPLTTTTSAQASAISSSSGSLLTRATPNPPSTPLALGVTGVTTMSAVAPHATAAHPLQPSLVPQRLVLTSQAQARLPSGDVVKVVGQGRITQPETPVTLQFQGNKFTLSPSQLRQLTTGQPLQLQGTLGNILQIVSAPGQTLLRPQGPPMVMPNVPQAVPVQNSSGTPPNATSTPQQATTMASTTVTQATTDMGANAKHSTNTTTQDSSEERNRQLKERLASLFHANERRSSRSVMYGSDLIKTCSVYGGRPPPAFPAPQHSRWSWVGRDSCIRAQQTCVSTVAPLRSAILSNTEQEAAAGTLLKRFSCILPAAVAPPPQLYASNPPPSYSLAQKSFRRQLQEVSAPHNAEIHNLAYPPVVRFPDAHMLEMDSGKLEALSILLQKLSAENRRVLIFTQMTSMLDILEAFLDHRHLTYVRLDESLSLEERQEQVKRFNRNRQIFCTILTNRCCSAMGHVFDADTIVFYDTDLNPSMDLRTQEWCDKIGRSKDIHIYRLESGNSIEEKLLKNGTKDLIREVAAQGMDYTLAFLTQRTIQDLFEVEAGSGEKVEEFVVLHQEPSPSESIPPHVARPYIQALNTIRKETQYEDEVEETEADMKSEKVGGQEEMDVEEGVREEASQIEELAAVMEQLTPIERYALHYLEYLHISEDEQVIKERVEAAKKGWEQQQQQKLKVEKTEQMMLEDEEDLFTYTREDAYNMEYVFENEDGQTEIMPLWTPPTPPQDDNDIYIDSVICLMYDSVPMPESKLPPVYVRKERKRHMDPSALGRKKKKGHGESVIPPRSLFDKASLLKVRREGKDQKKNFSLKQQAPFAKPLPSLLKPAMEAGQDNPEWLISEDWALLQAVKQLLELPLNLTIVSPAHTPNWDLVSDVVNSCSRVYRSPKQCRNRYENVIIPREEGKLIYEANPKKNKTKSIYKSKNSRPLRTCQIYTQDDNATQIQLYNNRFELMKIIASKRSPPIRPLLGMNPFQKNPKHASVLAESGISYDKPLPPIQVASQRAERIAKEKKALAEQQKAQQQQQQTTGATQPQGAAAQPQAQPQATAAAGVPQPNQSGAAAVPNTAVLTGAIKTAAVGTSIQQATATVSGNVIVNTVAGVPPGQFQANKRLASPVIPGALPTVGTATAQVVHTQQRAVPATASPTEVVAIAAGQSVRAVTPVTASAVVTANLTPAPGMQLTQGKPLTQAQFQQLQLRQQLQQQQQQQPQAASPQIKAVGKPQQELLKKQKLQMAQQQVAAAVAAAQGQQASSTQQPQQVHTTPAATSNPQIAAVAAPRAGAVLPVTNLQVARLTRVQASGPIQGQQAPTAQVTLTKPPPVVSVPAVVSSAGVTTLPVTVAGISVAIGQGQKAGGQVVTHPFQVQQLLNRQKQQAAAQAAAVQKAAQPQQTQAAVQQKLGTQQATHTTVQQQQKVYTTTPLQPAIKTQFFTTSIGQPQKPPAAQQIQVTKIPQIVQQQIVSSPQQIQAQTVALTQAAPAAGSAQAQVIPTGTAQVVQQKLLQQQVVTAAGASPQIQTPPPHSPAQQQSASESPAQQATAAPQPQQGKGNTRTGATMRSKTPAKPSGGS
ncbi:E1A-binding protein p400 isoform X2 [Carassius gibelio]|uniref:E1A-binding protein p400 isoform X2 n=1 Tax=Carassius gibelio TaxID=101364 RepID=UPI00227849DA|nr:E1A-binding protein p400 isoform X2 [Carassius gibelio]